MPTWAPDQYASCRSCRQRIVWAVVRASGKRIPLDPEPRGDGNLAVIGATDTGVPAITYLRGGTPPMGDDPVDADRFATHFATCPNAARHRRR